MTIITFLGKECLVFYFSSYTRKCGVGEVGGQHISIGGSYVRVTKQLAINISLPLNLFLSRNYLQPPNDTGSGFLDF